MSTFSLNNFVFYLLFRHGEMLQCKYFTRQDSDGEVLRHWLVIITSIITLKGIITEKNQYALNTHSNQTLGTQFSGRFFLRGMTTKSPDYTMPAVSILGSTLNKYRSKKSIGG